MWQSPSVRIRNGMSWMFLLKKSFGRQKIHKHNIKNTSTPKSSFQFICQSIALQVWFLRGVLRRFTPFRVISQLHLFGEPFWTCGTVEPWNEMENHERSFYNFLADISRAKCLRVGYKLPYDKMGKQELNSWWFFPNPSESHMRKSNWIIFFFGGGEGWK